MVRVVSLTLLVVGVVALAGCGEKGLATYPVTGMVMVDGQPAGGARVIFCPTASAPEDIARLRPAGVADANGKFGLTTFVIGDGAPAGEYNVMVRWDAPAAGGDSADRDRGPGAKDRLKGKYWKPDASGVSATIEEGETTLPPFQLSVN